MSYFERQTQEIASDRVLRIYGAILALTHLLTLSWWLYDGTDSVLSAGREHLCWPLLEACQDFSYPSHDALEVGLVFYGVLSAATALLFAGRKEVVRVAYGALAFLTVAKVFLMALDFRTRMNQHYMIFFVAVAFLLLPNKTVSIKLLIPFFYFWAGTLKLNREWLSGAALYGRLWLLDARTTPWACAYVVCLELVGIWGLWARSRTWFWATLLQLLAFHLMSYSVVNFFYPVLMLGLLAIYPLNRVFGAQEPPVFRSRAAIPGLVLVAAFSALQLLPYAFPGDTTLTGEGRLFALHMFDARVVCESQATIRREGANPERVSLYMPLVPRIQCDPIVYLSRGKSLCKALAHTPGFIDLDLKLESKRWTDARPVTVMNLEGFCRRNPRYSLLSSNDWILK